ncbi:unnamed protein product [Caenorhabditis nigoni]
MPAIMPEKVLLLKPVVRMSRDIVCATENKNRIPLTPKQKEMNSLTMAMFDACFNELYFVIKSQPFPFDGQPRFADELMKRDAKITEMLKKRGLVTAEVFETDQIVFEQLLEDFRREIGVQYKELYMFMLLVEETHAFQGLCAMFEVEEIIDDLTDAERHVWNFINRRFEWLNGAPQPESCWLYNALTYYNDEKYVKNEYKDMLMERYGPENMN